MTTTKFCSQLFGSLALIALAGCVAPPPVILQAPPVQQQSPFVAVPGPGKTAALFQQDDAICRRAPAAPLAQAGQQPATPQGFTPGVGYLQCMEGRNNLIEPMPVAGPPVVYGYLPSYPVYVGPWYGYGYPWYYGSVGFGYGGFGYGGFGYRGYGGYRGGYGGGYGGYGGRGGYGGGYGGGGFRGGGGFGGRR